MRNQSQWWNIYIWAALALGAGFWIDRQAWPALARQITELGLTGATYGMVFWWAHVHPGAFMSPELTAPDDGLQGQEEMGASNARGLTYRHLGPGIWQYGDGEQPLLYNAPATTRLEK